MPGDAPPDVASRFRHLARGVITATAAARGAGLFLVGDDHGVVALGGTGAPLWKLDPGGRAQDIALSKDGRFAALLSAPERKSPRLVGVDAEQGKILWEGPPTLGARAIDLAPDGRIALATRKGEVEFYDPAGRRLGGFDAGFHIFRILLAGPERGALLAGRDGYLTFRDPDGSERWRAQVPGTVHSISATPDGSLILVAAGDKGAYAVSAGGDPEGTFVLGAGVRDAVPLADGSAVILATTDRRIGLVQRDGKVVLAREVPEEPIRLHAAGDGAWLAFVTTTSVLEVWDIGRASGGRTAFLEVAGSAAEVRKAALWSKTIYPPYAGVVDARPVAGDGFALVTDGAKGVVVYDGAGQPIARERLPARALGVDATRGGRRAAVVTTSGAVVYDHDRRRLTAVRLPGETVRGVLSPDGGSLATLDPFDRLSIWDLAGERRSSARAGNERGRALLGWTAAGVVVAHGPDSAAPAAKGAIKTLDPAAPDRVIWQRPLPLGRDPEILAVGEAVVVATRAGGYVAFDPDGRALLAGAVPGGIQQAWAVGAAVVLLDPAGSLWLAGPEGPAPFGPPRGEGKPIVLPLPGPAGLLVLRAVGTTLELFDAAGAIRWRYVLPHEAYRLAADGRGERIVCLDGTDIHVLAAGDEGAAREEAQGVADFLEF